MVSRAIKLPQPQSSEYVEWPARRSSYGFLREDVQKQARGPPEKPPQAITRVTAIERTVRAYALAFLLVFLHCLLNRVQGYVPLPFINTPDWGHHLPNGTLN